ncbi:YrbL family protein [Psychroserpens jangbogonensis]|uniref:YrbL family protein n=1 Tax=Psychroserpens jangbogonensis TaxID=1484460 RepID=UPI00053D9988|nr:YrbL family protein [Psychroserpens jangbogonensis]
MIEIKDNHFIAEGVYQKCYIHPENKNLCIKVSKQELSTSRLLYEINYFKKISKKNWKKFDYPFFTKYYGQVDTNLGTGFVYDYITDETTGEISKTMEYYLLNPDPKITNDMLRNAFEHLKRLMIKHRIIASDIRSKNICCKILKDQSIQMIIVDGVGHRDFIPIVDWSSYFAKKKIERRLIKHDLHNLEAQREFLKKSEK